MIQAVKASPLFKTMDNSHVPLSSVGAALNEYMKSAGKKVQADDHAIKFYFMNHVTQIIDMDGEGCLDQVREDFLKQYVQECSLMAQRAFYYLLIICARETRHMKVYPTNLGGLILQDVGIEAHKAMTYLTSHNSDQIVDWLRVTPPESAHCSIGLLTEAMSVGFYKGKYNGGYGGPAWGRVADCLHSFVCGKISAEIMLDTIWTLSHNNGPIFNKPYLYNTHTSDLLKILDVQRSGQMPQLLHDFFGGIKYFNSTLENHGELYSKVLNSFGGDYRLTGSVDWYKVEALGAVGSYSAYKDKQDSMAWVSPYKDVPVKAKMKLKKSGPMAYIKEYSDFSGFSKKPAKKPAEDSFFELSGVLLKTLTRSEL